MTSPHTYDGTKVREEIEKIEKILAGSSASERNKAMREAIVVLDEALDKIEPLKQELAILRDLLVSMHKIENALGKK